MPNSVYLDACVFIEVLQRDLPSANPARVDACRCLVDDAKKGKLIIVTSALMITEVNRLDELGAAGMLPEEQSQKILDFFENDYFNIRQLDRATAELAHHLTRTHGLGNWDAVHVATALQHKSVLAFYTYDGAKARGRKGLLKHDGKIGTPPLRIECPPAPSDYPLFNKSADETPPAELPAPPAANGSTQS